MTKQMKFGLVMLATAVLSVASLVNARGWVQNGADWFYTDSSNEIVTETIQASGNSKFYLGEDGAMQRDFFLEDYNDATYYFGSNGAMVTNTWVAIDSSMVEDPDDYIPDAYWFYFGGNGKAVKGKDTLKPTTIDGRKYIFNAKGHMCTGWVKTESGTVDPEAETNPFSDALYYCGGDNDGVVRIGWVSYYDGYDTDDDDYRGELNTLYFYFGNNGKKTAAVDETTVKTKKINGRTYAFNYEGIMMSGWDAYENQESKWDKPRYFSGEDDGHMVQKGWVYAVPGVSIDSKAYDEDEEKYMYFQNNGNIYKNAIKKINGKYYVFDANGIMKTGLIAWNVEGDQQGVFYAGKIDLDEATGEELMKRGVLSYSDTNKHEISWTGIYDNGNNHVKLHYFGSDGARRIGANVIEFSDNNYTFVSKNSGHYDSGVIKKKYYSSGILCQADPDLKFGLFAIGNGDTAPLTSMGYQANSNAVVDDNTKFGEACNAIVSGLSVTSGYEVLGTSGSKVKGAKNAKKDADGNYWLIDSASGFLVGIYTVPVRYNDNSITFKTLFDMYTFPNGYWPTVNGRLQRSASGNAAIAWLKGNASTPLAGLEAVESISGETFKDAEMITYSYYDSNSGNTVDPQGIFANHGQFVDNKFTVISVNVASVSGYANYVGRLTMKLRGYWYQSDYNGNSNKWLPVGIKDQAGNTAHVYDYCPMTNSSNTEGGVRSLTSQSYSVCPDDTYFLNCFWNDIQSY